MKNVRMHLTRWNGFALRGRNRREEIRILLWLFVHMAFYLMLLSGLFSRYEWTEEVQKQAPGYVVALFAECWVVGMLERSMEDRRSLMVNLAESDREQVNAGFGWGLFLTLAAGAAGNLAAAAAERLIFHTSREWGACLYLWLCLLLIYAVFVPVCYAKSQRGKQGVKAFGLLLLFVGLVGWGGLAPAPFGSVVTQGFPPGWTAKAGICVGAALFVSYLCCLAFHGRHRKRSWKSKGEGKG